MIITRYIDSEMIIPMVLTENILEKKILDIILIFGIERDDRQIRSSTIFEIQVK